MLFLSEQGAPADARLLLTPKRIIHIGRADSSESFTSDDYRIQAAARRLILTINSRIPRLDAVELYPPQGSDHSIARKYDDATRNVLFENGHWFHDRQVEVTYETDERWTGFEPKVATTSLQQTLGKLRRRESVTIAVTGDSISAGMNSSGFTGVRPRMPAYPQLVAAQLEACFNCKITLVNRAVSGWRVEDALKDLPKLLQARPNLVIVAYGMNHVASHDPDEFKRLMAAMIDRIHAADHPIEMILVAPMYGNSQWSNAPREQFPLHRDVLASFVGPGTVLCDLTTLWGQLLQRKRDIDLTGNGVNHPNDFGHRLYAQAILGLLLEMPQASRN
ncbi:MAG: SGNH/GDSL hydrolase family protein [Pirellulales bacterium]|nr:SGNH/GDSL hydrolase family protein [Pirellulales bacterium]